MDWTMIRQWREFLKESVRDEVDFSQTDQNTGIPMPPVEKPWSGGELIDLPGEDRFDFPVKDFRKILKERESRRVFVPHEMKLEELAFLLWATQGVRAQKPWRVLRLVPSAGNRHPAETYLAVFQVRGLKNGLYHYLPLTHQLEYLREVPDLAQRVHEATREQRFTSQGNVLFIWTVLPYRTEWRYDYISAKVIAMDLGHIAQNLYLACEAIGYGTCAIGAYDQAKADELLGVDGDDEFTIYMAPVGKPRPERTL